MPFGIGWTELIIVLVIVLLFFGPKRLPSLAQSLGKSVRELKSGLSGEGEGKDVASADDASDKSPAKPAANSESK